MTSGSVYGVAVVVPMFSPDQASIAQVAGLARQAERVVLVNDNPADSEWADAFTPAANVEIVRHAENRGIAAALNTGTAAALAHPSTRFVLTLDQDSILPEGYIAAFIAEHASRTFRGEEVGILCPERMNGRPVATRWRTREPYDPMQSGMVIPIETFGRVGTFDESLFIDAVDSEFTLRTRRAGLPVVSVPGSDLAHGLGRQTAASLFGKTITWRGSTKHFSSHSPARLYYISRNHLRVNLRYATVDPRWVVRRVYEDLKLIGINVAFGSDPAKSIRAAATGLVHALLRRSGPIPPGLAERLAS
ncbi:glycosyltransferase [Sinomonas sp. ASV486]|uniref:glycosyltransferase n=1 Tax=Sinomonas sp. ASV486 TaxID=3051170 RepID=UPI0027DCF798|nr:glycosyltransferase [Sinomonas sp. ASV486]MDQ4490981.1 glycosyltransferase [Sinomonas sp. ASV486]